jgi:hypothetical protein
MLSVPGHLPLHYEGADAVGHDAACTYDTAQNGNQRQVTDQPITAQRPLHRTRWVTHMASHPAKKYSSNLTPRTPGLRHTTLTARRGAPGHSCNSNRCGTLSTPAALSSAKEADELWTVHSSSRDPFAKLITPA